MESYRQRVATGESRMGAGGWRRRPRPAFNYAPFPIRHSIAFPMADDDIPFNRTLPLAPGELEEVAPGGRRLLCDNPSPFTFKGTMSYIVGRGQVAIIDPGPDDERHVEALLAAVRGETVSHIIVTHTHRDHSPGA